MYESPKLWPALLYSIVGGVAFAIAQSTENVALQVAAGFIFLVVLVILVVVFFRFIGYYAVEYFDQYQTSASRTKSSLLAEKIRDLTKEQLQVVKAQGELGLIVQPAAEGPRIYVQGTTVPLDFVLQEYLPSCLKDNTSGKTYLPPIRRWSDGHEWYDYGERRDLARQFTDHLVHLGWATWGIGNERAWLTAKRDVAYIKKALGQTPNLNEVGPTYIYNDDDSSEESYAIEEEGE